MPTPFLLNNADNCGTDVRPCGVGEWLLFTSGIEATDDLYLADAKRERKRLRAVREREQRERDDASADSTTTTVTTAPVVAAALRTPDIEGVVSAGEPDSSSAMAVDRCTTTTTTTTTTVAAEATAKRTTTIIDDDELRAPGLRPSAVHLRRLIAPPTGQAEWKLEELAVYAPHGYCATSFPQRFAVGADQVSGLWFWLLGGVRFS